MKGLVIFKILWHAGFALPCLLLWIAWAFLDGLISPWRTAAAVFLEGIVVLLLLFAPLWERVVVDRSLGRTLGIAWREPPTLLRSLGRHMVSLGTLGGYMALQLMEHTRFLLRQGLKNDFAIWHMEDIVGTGSGTFIRIYPCVRENAAGEEVVMWCSWNDWLLVLFAIWVMLDIAAVFVVGPLTRRRPGSISDPPLRGLVELVSGTSWVRRQMIT